MTTKLTDMEYPVQTRSELNGLRYFVHFHAAMEAAKNDESIWKISITIPHGEQIRLVKNPAGEWVYEPII